MNRLLLLLVSAFAVCTSTLGQNVKEIATQTLNSTVSIFMLDNSSQLKSLGSGVIVAENQIVTNYHVIDGAYSGYIKLNKEDSQYKIEGILNLDVKNDLALLKVSEINSRRIELNESEVEVGESIYAAGNPQGLTGTFSDGIVSGKRVIDGKDLIQITAPISPGSSGGPVVNSTGKLIGISVGAYTSGQNLNFAIPAKYVSVLLATKKDIQPIKTLFKNSNPAIAKSSVKIQGIELRNIIWEQDDLDYEHLKEFSIKNNTDYTIGKVRLLLLIYDKTKTMVDFADKTFENDLNVNLIRIPPNMAKIYDAYNQYTDNFVKREGYLYEIRILDYEIIK